MPVQRIPRYNLLLRELVKHTWPMHPDFAVLDAGVERLSNIAMFLNEKKREAEALQRTFHVQEILDKGGSNVQVANGSRRYLHEGELYDNQGKAIVVYLFSDLMVICGDKNDRAHTEADERRANRKKIKLSEIVDLDESVSVVEGTDDVLVGKYQFSVRIAKQNRIVGLTAASAAIKKEWLDMLRTLQVKLSTLAMLHVSDDSGSPSMQVNPSPNGSRTARGSKRSDVKLVHRRSKSKADEIPSLLQRKMDMAGPSNVAERDLTVSHDGVPALPERKNRFFPLASPRLTDRHSESPDSAPPKPEKNKSSIRKAKLNSVPTADDQGGAGAAAVGASGGVGGSSSSSGGASPALSAPTNEDSGAFDHLMENRKGSIRLRLGAVMKFTKLWDKETKEEEDSGEASAEVRRPSMESGASGAGSLVVPASNNSGSVAPAIILNSPLSKRGTDSDDMAKLGKLMRGRKHKDGEVDEHLRDSGVLPDAHE